MRRALQAWGMLAMAEHGGDAAAAQAYVQLQEWLFQSAQRRLEQLARAAGTGVGPRVYLQHISKAGGTTLCRAASANGCVLHGKHNNCWIDGLGPLWMGMRHSEFSCTEKAGLYHGSGKTGGHANFLANEGTMDGGALAGRLPEDLCLQDLLYITMLREPMARAISHLNQHGVVRGQDRPAFDAMSMHDQIKYVCNTTGKVAVLDNFMTRCLLGEATYNAPLLSLAPNMALQAARTLAQFDVVLTLEHPHKGALLAQLLGWHVTDLDSVMGRAHRCVTRKKKEKKGRKKKKKKKEEEEEEEEGGEDAKENERRAK